MDLSDIIYGSHIGPSWGYDFDFRPGRSLYAAQVSQHRRMERLLYELEEQRALAVHIPVRVEQFSVPSDWSRIEGIGESGRRWKVSNKRKVSSR